LFTIPSIPLSKKRIKPKIMRTGFFMRLKLCLIGNPCGCLGSGNFIEIKKRTGRIIKSPIPAIILS